ncbi:hypothetical protein NX059_011454 [Plenodomus lindquistii]|nr:hypothetical protein NX059_011454 [Plenodomus lindquistii]
MRNPNTSYRTRSLRKACAIRTFAVDDEGRGFGRYFITSRLARHNHHEALKDMVARLRDDHRQRNALRRRGIPYNKLHVAAAIPNKHLRPQRFPTIMDRQHAQLSTALERHQTQHTTSFMTPPEGPWVGGNTDDPETQLSLKSLHDITPQINSALRCLLKLKHSYEYFEDLSDDVLRYLNQVAPALKHLGARALDTDWDWWTFRAVYDFLFQEDEWGRLEEPLVAHRKFLEEVANVVGLDLEGPPLRPATEWTPLYNTDLVIPNIGGTGERSKNVHNVAHHHGRGQDQPTWSPQHTIPTTTPPSYIQPSLPPPPVAAPFTPPASLCAQPPYLTAAPTPVYSTSSHIQFPHPTTPTCTQSISPTAALAPATPPICVLSANFQRRQPSHN